MWIPRLSEDKGVGRVSNARALKLGPTFRPSIAFFFGGLDPSHQVLCTVQDLSGGPVR